MEGDTDVVSDLTTNESILTTEMGACGLDSDADDADDEDSLLQNDVLGIGSDLEDFDGDEYVIEEGPSSEVSDGCESDATVGYDEQDSLSRRFM